MMDEHDVPYFRGILSDHTARLKELCKEWHDTSSSETVPEDVSGEIRTAIGLTELLMDQRFKQFSGLVDDCEYQRGEKKTTCEDLQGFWDMVYQEVEKVDKKFNNLSELKTSDWKTKEESKPVPVIRKKPIQGKNAKQGAFLQTKTNSNARAYIIAARQKLAEAKAQQKTAMKNASRDSEETKENIFNIPANVKSKAPEEKKAKRTGGASKGAPEGVSKGVPGVSRGCRAKDKVAKDFIPLACVTRSATRALMAKNQSTR